MSPRRGKGRKSKEDDEEWTGKAKCAKQIDGVTCILHNKKVSHDSDFTPLSKCKGDPHSTLMFLKDIKRRRLAQDLDSKTRMKEVCDLIPDSLEGLDFKLNGWHRNCYQSFTKNQDRIKVPSLPQSPQAKRRSPRKSASSTILFPKDECLFCGKNRIRVKKDGSWAEELPDRDFVKWLHKESGWENIVKMAEVMKDIGYRSAWRKSIGVDLAAAEAHFHDSCQKKFYVTYAKQKQEIDKHSETDFSRKSAAHNKAYIHVVGILKQRLIEVARQ